MSVKNPTNEKIKERLRNGESVGEIAKRFGFDDSAPISRIKRDMKKRGELNGTAPAMESNIVHPPNPRTARSPRTESKRDIPTCTLVANLPNGGTAQVFIKFGNSSVGSVYVTESGIAFARNKLSQKRKAKVVPFETLEKLLTVLS